MAQEPPKGKAFREYLVSPLPKEKIRGPIPRENSVTPIPTALAMIKWPNSWNRIRMLKTTIAIIMPGNIITSLQRAATGRPYGGLGNTLVRIHPQGHLPDARNYFSSNNK